MSIQEYFDGIYCINLKSRSDRWKECELEFKRQKIKGVTRFEGIEGIPSNLGNYGTMGVKSSELCGAKRLSGRVGCLLSHLGIIKIARENNFKRILILEDDVQFVKKVQSKFELIYRQIPDQWTLLYFGGNEKGSQRQVSENILRVSNMLMAHAVGIDCFVYDELITLLAEVSLPVDVYYAQLQKKYPCYALYPYLAWQRAGWSDIEQRFRIYDFENTAPFLEDMLKAKVKNPDSGDSLQQIRESTD